MIRIPRHFALRSRARRGLTMIETMISLLISGMVTSVVVYMMFQSALTTKDMYAETRTRSTRMRALDQIRYRLVEAQIGTVDITNSGRRIEFIDPNLDVTSAFFFVLPDPVTAEGGTLFYDEDVDNSDPEDVVQGPIDLTFELENDDATNGTIILNVRTAAPIGMGDVDTQDGVTVVYMRNV